MADLHVRARIAESAEAEFVLAMAQAAPEDVSKELGMHQARIGGGIVTAMEHDPTGGFWSKGLGFGFTEPFGEGVVDEVLTFFEESRVPAAVVQVSPLASPSTWSDALAARGLTPSRTWVKFVSEIRLIPHPRTELEVREIAEEDLDEFAKIYTVGFGMPEGPLTKLFRALPGAPGWQCFGAWDGSDLVSVANLFVAGDVGVLGGAATLPDKRGRGGQTALMSVRVAAAAAAGCAWISSETGSESEEEPNPSLHNMRRLELGELYTRTNWVYRR